jgi:hypothetical protein
MKADDFALVQGWPHTVATLKRWNAAPWPVMRGWALASLAVALLLLGATWLVASARIPDPEAHGFAGVTRPATMNDFAFVVMRNLTVLALHAMACVAGFIAGWPSATPQSRLHKHAGPSAILFVIAATIFSLITQAGALGAHLADLAAQFGMSPLALLAALTPHALPELLAVFLPLAAWSIASRRGAWHELLAATLATTAVAVPLIWVAALVETWVTPRLLVTLIG